jgi:undecaprenyl-diphosphatase
MTVLPQTMLEFISSRDHRVMRRLNSWRAPRWIRLWMICATRGGDGWLWYSIGLCVLFFSGEHAPRALLIAGSATAAGALLFHAMKRITGRRRPCAIAEHCWANLLPPDQFSFPSGHSITAFSFAVGLGLYYPGLLPWLLFCAFSVAISRIVLGMHFLSDVVVGAGLGTILGYCSFALLT